jgi:hypothetical protein
LLELHELMLQLELTVMLPLIEQHELKLHGLAQVMMLLE